MVFGLSGLLHKFSFLSLGCSLFGAYFLADRLHLLPFDFGKELLLSMLLLLFGLSLLPAALRKSRKPGIHIRHDGSHKEAISSFEAGEHSFLCDNAFTDHTRQVDLSRLDSGEADCSFGTIIIQYI